MIKYKPVIVIISAASGTGKTTVIKRVLDLEPELFYSVSATTREKRPNEVHGKDYLFVDHVTFKKWIQEGKLLEWAEVYGEYYGTPRQPIEEALSNGKSVIADLDVHGMKKLKEVYGENAVSVFLFPPDFETLVERLRKRSEQTGESEEQLKIRINKAKEELSNARFYDYWVLNEDDMAEEAALRIIHILKAAECNSKRLSFKIPEE